MGKPLRMVSKKKNNAISVKINGNEKSRLIDLSGNSKYFNTNGKRVSPQPTISSAAYGGEIYKNRYNYYKKHGKKN